MWVGGWFWWWSGGMQGWWLGGQAEGVEHGDDDGRVAVAGEHFKRPWNDGSTQVVFSPQVFLERLAALIPPPRAHLVTYHGVLAPGAELRDAIVPAPPRRKSRSSDHASQTTQTDPPAPKLTVRNMPDYQRRYPWAELLRRVFLEDVLQCEC